MGCSAICKTLIGSCLVISIFLIPVGLTIGFGMSLYSFPQTLSFFAIGYHVFCIIIHLLALSIYVYQQKKLTGLRIIFKYYFSTVVICAFLLIFQVVFSTLGIVVGVEVSSKGPNIVCETDNSTTTTPIPDESINMYRKFDFQDFLKIP